MAKEEFPRFRTRDLPIQSSFKLPYYRGGRLDLECASRYGMPTAYKVFAAANRLMNPMLTRPGIRPSDESIRNELVLRGYSGAALEAEFRRVTEATVRGVRDWLGYSDFGNGNITDVEPGMLVFVPSPDSAVRWYDRYNELNETADSQEEE
jgi:hypothetical protein